MNQSQNSQDKIPTQTSLNNSSNSHERRQIRSTSLNDYILEDRNLNNQNIVSYNTSIHQMPKSPKSFIPKKRNYNFQSKKIFEYKNNSPEITINGYNSNGVNPKNESSKFKIGNSPSQQFQQTQQNKVSQVLSKFSDQETNRKRSESLNM